MSSGPTIFSLNSILILSFQHSGLSFGGYIVMVIKSRRESWAELLARKEKVKTIADINRKT
jgi:alpha/beta superfamily hydrolase